MTENIQPAVKPLTDQFTDSPNRAAKVRLFTVVLDGSKAWQYTFCLHHADEFMDLSRKAGDEFKYYYFLAQEDTFCGVCWAKDEGRSYYSFPQVTYKVVDNARRARVPESYE